jgi:hypothetical protein
MKSSTMEAASAHVHTTAAKAVAAHAAARTRLG